MKNIVLIGFMGSGKSSVGEKLAKKLDLEFVDSDQLLVERAGKEISQIFAQFGERHFRQLEKEVIADLAQKEEQVLATGGGVVLDIDNIKALRENGVLILLEAGPELILERVADSGRPLLEVEEPLEEIKKLLAQRKDYYQQAADCRIDTSQLEVEEVVERIIGII